jgi:hypothetical protein
LITFRIPVYVPLTRLFNSLSVALPKNASIVGPFRFP